MKTPYNACQLVIILYTGSKYLLNVIYQIWKERREEEVETGGQNENGREYKNNNNNKMNKKHNNNKSNGGVQGTNCEMYNY